MTYEQKETIAHGLARLFDEERWWTKHALAKENEIILYDATNRFATCWCLLGGIRALTTVEDYQQIVLEFADMIKFTYEEFQHMPSLNVADSEELVAKWNDDPTVTHTMLVSLIKETIYYFKCRKEAGQCFGLV